jgi:hypothetical protein
MQLPHLVQQLLTLARLNPFSANALVELRSQVLLCLMQPDLPDAYTISNATNSYIRNYAEN